MKSLKTIICFFILICRRSRGQVIDLFTKKSKNLPLRSKLMMDKEQLKQYYRRFRRWQQATLAIRCRRANAMFSAFSCWFQEKVVSLRPGTLCGNHTMVRNCSTQR